jgi:hypothetical protein
MSQPLHLNDRGDAVRAHQGHLNTRLHAHRHAPIEVDGECGPCTIEATALAAWFLGELDGTVELVRDGTIPTAVQAVVADPSTRTAEQRERAVCRRDRLGV